MITNGIISMPRRYEGFNLFVANFTIDMLNGKLAEHVVKGTQGYVVADFIKNRAAGVPRGAFGSITLIDGKSNGILDIPNALIQIEEGAREGSWKILANFAASGFSTEGRAYAFRTADSGEVGDTSITIEFAVANEVGLAGMGAVSKWLFPN